MSFNQTTILPLLDQAETIEGVLNAAGYPAQIVGGALRVLALGGTTGDVDVAVMIEDWDDLENLKADLRILLNPLGHRFVMQHCAGMYSGTDGFIADWRSKDINIIAYNKSVYDDGFKGLVGKFDLNINQWYYDADGELANDFYDGDAQRVKLNPKRDNCGRLGRLDARIKRFKADLPNLDWSEFNE